MSLILSLIREQAQTYVYEPTRVDSKRGLKRSWTGSKRSDTLDCSSPSNKPTVAEKGT